MAADTPLIDSRTYSDLVAEVETLAETYTEGVPTSSLGQTTPGWRRGQGDFGGALVRVFARLAELALDRLNRLPDRNFLAFLDLVGVRPEPPQPARTPITFELAAGSPDALVPAGTQVAATPLEGETAPVLFETERDLVVTRTQLALVFTREPGRDRFADVTALATGQAAGDFTPFAVADDPADPGRNRIGHRLYIGHSFLASPEVKDEVVVRLTPDDPTRPWPRAVTWEAWDGTGWTAPVYDPQSDITPDPKDPASWTVTLHGLPPVPPRTVDGVTSSWLRGSLTTPLPSGELTDGRLLRSGPPTAAFAADPSTGTYEALNLSSPFLPFGERWLLPIFHLAVDQPLDKPASQVEIEIDVSGGTVSGSAAALLAPSTASLAVQPAAVLTTARSQLLGISQNLAVSPPDQRVPVYTWEYRGAGGWTAIPPDQLTFLPARGSLGGDVFASSGTVRFDQPLDWVAATVDGLPDPVPRFWLRVRVSFESAGVNVRSQPPVTAPVVTRVRCSVSWVLPRLNRLSLGAEWRRDELPGELGVSNQVPVDLTQDFFPFGEKPRIGDAFYLASDEAFAKPGAEVRIALQVTNPDPQQPGPPLSAKPSADLALAWEYWNGQKWKPLSWIDPGNPGVIHPVVDPTGGLAVGGTVKFTCPGDLAPVATGGKTARFIRVRINSGNYGVEATYVPAAASTQLAATTPAVVFQLVPASFRPPSIHSLSLGYTYTTPVAPPEHLVTENDFVFAEEIDPTGALSGPFTPFTPPQDDRPTLYLGFDRPGESTGFANRPTPLYFGVSPSIYDPAAAPQPVALEPTVVWQYWNGSGWQRLGTRDETRALSRRGLVTFLGPADFRAATEFGRTAFWLRARFESGDFPLPPRLARILLNTMWADAARTIAGEVLGSGRGEGGQTFTASQTPVLAGQQLEVVEPEVPSADELAALAAEEGEDALTLVRDAANAANAANAADVANAANTAGQVAEVRVRWHQVPDFYGSGPRSRHYTLDSATGLITFGDGQHGLPPPPGRGNVRLAHYRTGGGLAGNRPAGNIAKLKGTVPYVKGVVQTEPAAGGAATESLDELRVRGPRTLRHRDRAVAPADFEDLALAATTAIARARCLAARNGTDAGQVELVVVRRSPLAKPAPDLELLGEVEDYLAARLSPVVVRGGTGPAGVRTPGAAVIVPGVLEAAPDVENAVRDRLTAFLHPLTGGDGTGWSFGRTPHRSDLYALIESTPGVDHVDHLDVVLTPDEASPRPERSLIYAGTPEISVGGGAA